MPIMNKPLDCWNHRGVWAKEKRDCPELAHYSHCRNCLVYIRAGRKTLDQPVPHHYDMSWVDTWLKEPQDIQVLQQQRIIVFYLHDQYFALSLLQVREVLPIKAPTPLPHSNTTVLHGLTHVRGEICLYLSLSGFLSMPHIVIDDNLKRKQLIYSNIGEQTLVFPVDCIHGIMPYHDDHLQPLPDSLPTQQQQLAKGLIMMDINDQPQHVCLLDTTRWNHILEHLR